MDTAHEKCQYCGANIKKYWQRLTPGLVNALVKFKRAAIAKRINCLHLYDDLTGINELTTAEQMNWTKLRFHGMVAKYKNGGAWVRGKWLITTRGIRFLKGEIAVPRAVQTFHNRVVDHSPEMVKVGDVLSTVPYWDTYTDFKFNVEPITVREEGDVLPIRELLPVVVRKYEDNGQALMF